MKSAIQYIIHDKESTCCCCCCHCCFQINNNNIMQPSIPPWQIIIATPVLIETTDSFCSCCSCLSSISEGREQPLDGPSLEQPTMSPDEEKMTKKKLHAIDELLQTERDYVQDLSHLVEVSTYPL